MKRRLLAVREGPTDNVSELCFLFNGNVQCVIPVPTEIAKNAIDFARVFNERQPED